MAAARQDRTTDHREGQCCLERGIAIHAGYKLPQFPGVTLTGGVYYTGKRYANDVYTDSIPSDVTGNLVIRYTTTLATGH